MCLKAKELSAEVRKFIRSKGGRVKANPSGSALGKSQDKLCFLCSHPELFELPSRERSKILRYVKKYISSTVLNGVSLRFL